MNTANENGVRNNNAANENGGVRNNLQRFVASCRGQVTICVVSLIILVSIVSLISCIMLKPNPVNFQVQDAKLTRFDLDFDKSILSYNLSLTFVVRNPNNYFGFQYDEFGAMVYYNEEILSSSLVSFPMFYQGHKRTTVLGAVFQGQDRVLLGSDGRMRFENDKKGGACGIDVMVRIKMSRVLFGHLITKTMNPIVGFHVIVPFGSSNSSRGV
ncbi:unnamed protein product [Cochlearia groenlandica]